MSSKTDRFIPDNGYRAFLEEIKQNIQSAQIKAALSVNRSLIELYLNIGDRILQKQDEEGWGKSVIEHLAQDLKRSFLHLKGFSPRNLWNMRRLNESVRDNPSGFDLPRYKRNSGKIPVASSSGISGKHSEAKVSKQYRSWE